MSNLFSLQIGQARNWKLYSHSFLYYGMNEAIKRFESRLAATKTIQERLVDGIYNPCLPGGAQMEVRSNIHFVNSTGVATWPTPLAESDDGYYQAILKNDYPGGDADRCLDIVKGLLHLEQNDFCNFANRGECLFAGTYMPELPETNSETSREFLAVGNYHHVWKYLKLPPVASMSQLQAATRQVCAMNYEEDNEWAGPHYQDSEIKTFCFRSAYVFQVLHNGYGFRMHDTVRAVNVVRGQKVGWVLGAMLYEINTMPWSYKQHEGFSESLLPWLPTSLNHPQVHMFLFGAILVCLVTAMMCHCSKRRRSRLKHVAYEPVGDVE